MNNYEIKGNCMYSGLSCTRSVNAESESEAIEVAGSQGLSIKSIELKDSEVVVIKPVKAERHIIDAEEMLYEMDMNGVDEVTVQEAFGNKTTINRADVVKQLENATTPWTPKNA